MAPLSLDAQMCGPSCSQRVDQERCVYLRAARGTSARIASSPLHFSGSGDGPDLHLPSRVCTVQAASDVVLVSADRADLSRSTEISSSNSAFPSRIEDHEFLLARKGCVRRCATLILRLFCALAPSRESDARLQSALKFSSSLRSSHTHRYLPFLSEGSSWLPAAGTSHRLHSPRALAFPSLHH